MTRTLTRTLRSTPLAALALFAAAALVSAAPAAAHNGPGHKDHRSHEIRKHHKPHFPRFHGEVYIFSGTVAATPAPGSTTLAVTVAGGNRPALKALVGNTTTPLTFTVDTRTSYVAWTATTRGNAPSATTAAALKVGDPVHLRIRAFRHSSLATLLATPARIVNDFAGAARFAGRLFLFQGQAVAVDTTAKTITVDIRTGNWFALNAMLGQSTRETFTYDAATQFLTWSARTPQVFDPAQIAAGDPITLRTRAVFNTPLAALLSAPLWKVNDHEPSMLLAHDGGNLSVGN